ncbi:MAG: TetR/AcrR family transcriptional regulator [Clostridiales Family XIII bacterium]|jgi:AcrR family transcriptional regulator|nr:TetR/AcrR family transcriptional regulator [Clostridiales Family XIII bacterium]
MEETYAQSQKKLSKDSIFIALMKLLEKKDFNSLTVTQITRTAGVSRMAFYRSYQTKEDVITDYLSEMFGEFTAGMKRLGMDDKYHALRFYFSFFESKREFISLLIKAELTHLFYERLSGAIVDLFKTQNDKTRSDPAFTNYLAQFTAAGLFRTLLDWIKGGSVESVEEMANFIDEIT